MAQVFRTGKKLIVVLKEREAWAVASALQHVEWKGNMAPAAALAYEIMDFFNTDADNELGHSIIEKDEDDLYAIRSTDKQFPRFWE